MTPPLRFIPFRSPDDRGWDEAAAIYRNSFPRMEQRTAQEHLRAIDDPAFEADGIWLGDQLAGILYHWHYDDTWYVEHLAVSPALRGQHMGSRALEAFCRNRRVILEIDPPVDDISIRRLHFYQRLGFVENPHDYIHPSFNPPFKPHRLVLMSYPTPLADPEARDFARFVRERVLLYSEHEAPALPRL